MKPRCLESLQTKKRPSQATVISCLSYFSDKYCLDNLNVKTIEQIKKGSPVKKPI